MKNDFSADYQYWYNINSLIRTITYDTPINHLKKVNSRLLGPLVQVFMRRPSGSTSEY